MHATISYGQCRSKTTHPANKLDVFDLYYPYLIVHILPEYRLYGWKTSRATSFVNLSNMSKTLWALANSTTEVTLLSDFLIVAAESKVKEVCRGREDYTWKKEKDDAPRWKNFIQKLPVDSSTLPVTPSIYLWTILLHSIGIQFTQATCKNQIASVNQSDASQIAWRVLWEVYCTILLMGFINNITPHAVFLPPTRLKEVNSSPVKQLI